LTQTVRPPPGGRRPFPPGDQHPGRASVLAYAAARPLEDVGGRGLVHVRRPPRGAPTTGRSGRARTATDGEGDPVLSFNVGSSLAGQGNPLTGCCPRCIRGGPTSGRGKEARRFRAGRWRGKRPQAPVAMPAVQRKRGVDPSCPSKSARTPNAHEEQTFSHVAPSWHRRRS